MLSGLFIRDMLLIRELDLTFHPGLNVLTGETGAGKSILLDSLGFVLGWRGRADLVRDGAERGEVIAEFHLTADHPAHALLAEAGLPDEGETLLLRRLNGRDGRKQAFVNDRRCSGEILRQLSDTLVELHGQQDDRGLLNPRGHRDILDLFSGLGPQIAMVREAWKSQRAAETALADLELELEALERDRAFLEHAVDELETLNPQPGEDEALDKERRLMQSGAKVREDVEKVLQALGAGGAEGPLSEAARRLDDIDHKLDGLMQTARETVSRALDELADAEREVRDQMAHLDVDPHRLEATEERLFAIRALARKHDVQPDDLADFGGQLRLRLDRVEGGGKGREAARSNVEKTRHAYENAAKTLSTKRQAAARDLDRIVGAELPPLKLERARFTTRIEAGTPGPEGHDLVTFEVATNPGAPAGPLNKIASGGELSRFLLALKVALKSGRGVSMIFDEIDRGVGGATADAVGRRLAALGAEGQVLVVTHSPQVAARASYHMRVSKSVEAGQTRSDVRVVADAGRVDEIARMLAGETLTPEARAAAEALLVG